MESTGFLNIIFSFLTLSLLEVILGIDNLVFISILSHQLPQHKQKRARQIGLIAALVTRLLLLGLAVELATLTQPLFTIHKFALSIRDLFFIFGGIFLLIKGIHEIHREYESGVAKTKPRKESHFWMVILQMGAFDVIFSLDSILTAIGLTQQYWVMAAAISLSIFVMFLSNEVLSRLIQKYPTVKMLALSFLLLIGTILIADGAHFHIPRGYIYFAVCFSLGVELLNNIVFKRKKSP